MTFIITLTYWGGVYQYYKDTDESLSRLERLVDAIAWPWDFGKWLVRKGKLADR